MFNDVVNTALQIRQRNFAGRVTFINLIFSSVVKIPTVGGQIDEHMTFT